MRLVSTASSLASGLVAACDDPDLFGVELTPRQRELLASVEDDSLLHVWALGRRGGKTMLGALVALWFCLLRPELAALVRRRERRYAVAAAVNHRQARLFVAAARSIAESSPLLAALVESVSDDEVAFRNETTLTAFPCTSRGGRGWPVMCLLLDEAAHQLDGEGNAAAEPVFRALAPSVAQFGDAARIIVASSPYGTDGFFADLWHTVEKGDLDGARCAQHSTMVMRPGFATAALEMERQRDPEGYRSEYEAQFLAPGGQFFDAGRVAEAVGQRDKLRPGELADPFAAIDLAFTGDSSALCIVGRDGKRPDWLRLALARSWSPRPGAPLSFTAVLDEVAAVCVSYGVRTVFTDQFNAASAVEHLQRRGLRVTVVATTPASKSAMFADLRQRIHEGNLELYPHELLLAELGRVETVTTPGAANVRIRRAGGSHGDVATALALACWKIRGSGLGARSFVPRGRLPLLARTGRAYE